MINCLLFAVCYSRQHKNWCLQNFYSTKKWVLEIADKHVFKSMTIPNSLVLIWRFYLCFIHSTWLEKYLFSTIYGSWKLQTESWNTNHEYECSILTIRMLTSLETPLCFMSFISVTIFSILSQVSWNSNKSEAESRLIACSSSYLIIWRSRLSGWFF